MSAFGSKADMSGSGLLLRKLVQCPYSAGWRRVPVGAHWERQSLL